jgi:hypothetical protein
MYSVFSVVSDSGLWPVWIGFGMLCVAAVWRMWLTPAWKHLMRAADDQAPRAGARTMTNDQAPMTNEKKTKQQ